MEIINLGQIIGPSLKGNLPLVDLSHNIGRFGVSFPPLEVNGNNFRIGTPLLAAGSSLVSIISNGK